MAIGDSQVGICNSALIALQAQPIAALTDPVKSAILLTQQWDSTRRELLRSHPWRFATTYAALPASATAPPFGYANAFPLPQDCLRVFDCPDLDRSVEWEVVGNQLYTDASSPLNVIYIADIKDVTLFDAGFAAALALDLATNIGLALTGSLDKVQAAQRALSAKAKDAQRISAQEASSREWDIDVWLGVRR